MWAYQNATHWKNCWSYIYIVLNFVYKKKKNYANKRRRPATLTFDAFLTRCVPGCVLSSKKWNVVEILIYRLASLLVVVDVGILSDLADLFGAKEVAAAAQHKARPVSLVGSVSACQTHSGSESTLVTHEQRQILPCNYARCTNKKKKVNEKKNPYRVGKCRQRRARALDTVFNNSFYFLKRFLAVESPMGVNETPQVGTGQW